MLDQFFSCPLTLRRLRAGILGPHLDGFASFLSRRGYTRWGGRPKLRILGHFAMWLEVAELQLSDLSERVTDDFLSRRRRLRRGDRRTLSLFLEYLRAQSVVPAAKKRLDKSPIAIRLGDYENYLRNDRGLAVSTVNTYLRLLRRFLSNRFGNGPIQYRKLAPHDISVFLLRHAHSGSPVVAHLLTTALRSFFRFLFQRRKTKTDLSTAVPAVATWRLSQVPKYLKEEEVESLLNTCDLTNLEGRRDYAVLLLLARLGLRASEIVHLELEDINWRVGEITIRGKGLSTDRLPLPQDVGRALSAYLRNDRSPCCTRRVFLRLKAPRQGFSCSDAIGAIVRKALKKAGLNPPRKGAHLLRHSLATSMLRRGGTLTEIGEILRHRSVKTTEIYAKVDFKNLRSLARSWPGKGGEK